MKANKFTAHSQAKSMSWKIARRNPILLIVMVLSMLIFFLTHASFAFADSGITPKVAQICSPPYCKVYSMTATDGETLNVSDWGASNTSAPAILFIHGFPHDQFLWLNQINDLYLRSKYRIVTIDWRGHGLSGKPESPAAYSDTQLANDINVVVTNLQLNRFVIVAHSAGGFSLESYIKYYGTSNLRGIVITDAIVDNGVFAYVPGPVFNLIGQGAFAPTTDAFMAANQQFLTLSTKSALDPGLYNFLLTQNLLMPQAPRQALLGSLSTLNMTALQNINLNTLIIWGANDAVVTSGAANYLQGIIPNSQLLIVPNVGHLPMIEAPSYYDYLLDKFISSNCGK